MGFLLRLTVSLLSGFHFHLRSTSSESVPSGAHCSSVRWVFFRFVLFSFLSINGFFSSSLIVYQFPFNEFSVSYRYRFFFDSSLIFAVHFHDGLCFVSSCCIFVLWTMVSFRSRVCSRVSNLFVSNWILLVLGFQIWVFIYLLAF